MATNGASRLSRLDERFALVDGFSYVSADNATVTLVGPDRQHREYTDLMSAYGAVNFGHHNEEISQCLKRGSDVVGRCYPSEAEQVASWLCSRLARKTDTRVLFQVGGSQAVTAGIALAQQLRPGKVASVLGGFHGLGTDTLAASSIQQRSAIQNTALAQKLKGYITVIEPGSIPEAWAEISCLIYEPIQGANGYIPLDPKWLAQLEASAASAGVVTISDEVQAGFYRHGTLSPSNAAGLKPDIQLFSKSLTNGMFPLSAVVYDIRLEPPRFEPFLAHTFQTATFSYYAADAVTRYIDSTPLDQLAASVSAILQSAVSSLVDNKLVTDVHVTGPSLSFRPTRLSAREVVRSAHDCQILVCAGGATFERIRVAPPLTIPLDQLSLSLTRLSELLVTP